MGESPNTAQPDSAAVETAIVRACEVCGTEVQGGRLKRYCAEAVGLVEEGQK